MEHVPTIEVDPSEQAAPVEEVGRAGERGAGVVEWLGISALSIALLATIFTALNTVGVDLVEYIRTTLGI